ncbi:MAG: EamA family transporter [Verrucomicrobiota bacterium]
MKTWVIYAVISMVFAGVTSVIAKMGLVGISGELGLAVRTVLVFLFVMAFAVFTVPAASLGTLNQANYLWLGLSAVTTSLSWIFYYRALKDGQVSTIALIDKGSILVAIVLACVILKEQITPRIALGGLLILTGLAVIAKK